jgi:hypothetical protein
MISSIRKSPVFFLPLTKLLFNGTTLLPKVLYNRSFKLGEWIVCVQHLLDCCFNSMWYSVSSDLTVVSFAHGISVCCPLLSLSP